MKKALEDRTNNKNFNVNMVFLIKMLMDKVKNVKIELEDIRLNTIKNVILYQI